MPEAKLTTLFLFYSVWGFSLLGFKRSFTYTTVLMTSPLNTARIFCVSQIIRVGFLPEDRHAWVLSCFSRIWLFATPWTVAHQAALSMGFSRQEYWSGSSFPSPGDPPDPGIEPRSLMSPALAGRLFTTKPPGKPQRTVWSFFKKLKTELLYDLAIPLLGIYPDNTIIWKDTCTSVFIATLFTIAKTCKQPKYPSTGMDKEGVV